MSFLDKIKKMFAGGKNSAVGVDIGSNSIKVVELGKQGEQLVLKNYAIATGDEGFIQAGTSGVINEGINEAIKQLFKSAEIKPGHVNVAVPSFASLVTTIELPQVPKEEIEKIIITEAPKYIPVKLEDVVYGWELLEGVGTAQKDRMRVLIVAIMKEISDRYETVLASSGLKVDALEIDSFSLVRSLTVGQENKCLLILDLGHKVSNMLVVFNGNILLNRSVDLAGEKITKVIAQSMQVDENRAEQMKISGNQGLEFLGPTFDVIVDEVQKTREIFKKSYPDIAPESIIISGGTAKMKGLKEAIEKKASLPTTVGDALNGIAYPQPLTQTLQDKNPFLSVAIGLARLAFEKDKK